MMSTIPFHCLGPPGDPLLLTTHWHVVPGYVGPAHKTLCWYLALTLEGAMQSGPADGELKRYDPGDICLVRPGVNKRWGVLGDSAWHYLKCTFVPPAHFEEWLGLPAFHPGFIHLSLTDEVILSKVKSSFLELHQLTGVTPLEESGLAFNALERVLMLCFFHARRTLKVHVDSRVNAAVHFILSNLSRPLTLDDIAGACHLSRSHLTALFQQQINIGPVAFHRRQRIMQAMQMLAVSQEPVNQIAFHIGFEDPLYFSTCFRQQCGMSPRAYRRKCLEQGAVVEP